MGESEPSSIPIGDVDSSSTYSYPGFVLLFTPIGELEPSSIPIGELDSLIRSHFSSTQLDLDSSVLIAVVDDSAVTLSVLVV
jgi:hypothetical protein